MTTYLVYSTKLLKPYNLTYFITFIAVATFAGYKSSPFNRKPYKMFYIGDFIMKSVNENINTKAFYVISQYRL